MPHKLFFQMTDESSCIAKVPTHTYGDFTVVADESHMRTVSSVQQVRLKASFVEICATNVAPFLYMGRNGMWYIIDPLYGASGW